MAIKVYPYRQRSRSARRLADILGGKVLRVITSYMPYKHDVVINWGSSECPFRGTECRVLNHPSAVRLASNKARSFERLSEQGVNVPLFAFVKENVSWTGTTVVRKKLTGHSGEGIEIIEDVSQLPNAPLYVQYVKKKDEYRIHIVGQEITTIQRKAKRNEATEVNYKVRNLTNGFVFVRSDVNPPETVLEQARKAITALGLDFGAVDVIYNEKEGKAYVLEVNTAPGMEGSTIGEYAEGIKALLRSENKPVDG